MTQATSEPTLSPTDIAAEKSRLGIPDGGQPLRAWIRYQLQQRINAKTGKPWNQADIGRETFVSEGTISYIFTAQRVSGRKVERVRRVTAELLGIPEAVLFPPVPAKRGATEEDESE